jgi:hypothetical protein
MEIKGNKEIKGKKKTNTVKPEVYLSRVFPRDGKATETIQTPT